EEIKDIETLGQKPKGKIGKKAVAGIERKKEKYNHGYGQAALTCALFRSLCSPLTKVKLINELNEREVQLGVAEKVSWHSEYKDSTWNFLGGLPYELTEGDVIRDPKGKEDKGLTMDFERHFIPPCSAASSELCVDGNYKEGLNIWHKLVLLIPMPHVCTRRDKEKLYQGRSWDKAPTIHKSSYGNPKYSCLQHLQILDDPYKVVHSHITRTPYNLSYKTKGREGTISRAASIAFITADNPLEAVLMHLHSIMEVGGRERKIVIIFFIVMLDPTPHMLQECNKHQLHSHGLQGRKKEEANVSEAQQDMGSASSGTGLMDGRLAVNR
ncbi:hypothetical protein EI555_005549, partial [Monodon monoceros]